jgi:hypothetical protein
VLGNDFENVFLYPLDQISLEKSSRQRGGLAWKSAFGAKRKKFPLLEPR